MKRDLVSEFEHLAAKKDLCRWLGISRSTCYYKLSQRKRGAKPSTHTLMQDGQLVPNEYVVSTLISDVFSQEFNLYGYQRGRLFLAKSQKPTAPHLIPYTLYLIPET